MTTRLIASDLLVLRPLFVSDLAPSSSEPTTDLQNSHPGNKPLKMCILHYFIKKIQYSFVYEKTNTLPKANLLANRVALSITENDINDYFTFYGI